MSSSPTSFDGCARPGAAGGWIDLKANLLRRLDVLRPFDPWSSRLCTCPPKLAFDPYCGCGFECRYCYVSAYNPRCWGRDRVRPKKDILRRLHRDIAKLPDLLPVPLPVAVSNSSDPYPNAPGADEARLQITRQALAALADAGLPLLITTKSPLVVRDVDVLTRAACVVAMTITTLDEGLARLLEPHAPPPADRLRALAELARAGLACACRIDPIIPGVNDDEGALRELCARLAHAGVRRVVASTYKYKPDSFRRLAEVFPEAAERLRTCLDVSKRISGYFYLKRHLREELLDRVRRCADACGLSFSVCREGLAGFGGGICDARDLAGLPSGLAARPGGQR